jgi:cytochrome P450
MTHDEAIYTNPDDFNPDRYAKDPDGKPGEPFPVGHFGFGRRYSPSPLVSSFYSPVANRLP